jgi:hypothetical protein
VDVAFMGSHLLRVDHDCLETSVSATGCAISGMPEPNRDTCVLSTPAPLLPVGVRVVGGRRRSLVGGGEFGNTLGVDDNGVGNIAEARVSASAVFPHHFEGLVGGGGVDLSQDALGLFDDYASVESALELLGEYLAVPEGACLQQPDRGDVCQCLDDADVPGGYVSYVASEEVEGSDDLIS